MKVLCWKRGVVSFGLIAAAVAQAGAADNPLYAPAWKDRRLARVNYSSQGDLRKGPDLTDFRLNEDGIIEGSELLDLVQLGSFSMFEQALKSHPELNPANKTLRALYRDFLQDNLDRGMAILILNRIIDHEAMKRKLPPQVSDDRVNYVMRSILIQNAANRRKIRVREVPRMTPDVCNTSSRCFATRETAANCRPHALLDAQGKAQLELHPDENLENLGNDRMYPWLRETVGKNPVNFNIDWQFNEGGMGVEQNSLTHSRKELPWPGVSLGFERLPEDRQEFREMIRAKLQPSYRKLLRTMVWQKLVEDKNPYLNWQAQAAATPEQKSAYFVALRDTQLKVDHFKSDYLEIRLEGPKSAEFSKRFGEILALREAQYDPELKLAVNAPDDPAADERLMNRTIQLRASVPAEAYRETAVEFAADLTAQRLRATLSDSTVSYASSDEMPDGACYEDQSIKQAFNPIFLMMRIFPTMTGVAQDQSLHIMIPKKLQQLDATFLAQNDARVAKLVNQNIVSKQRGVAFRKVALELFSFNHVEYLDTTCSQPEWPCGTTDARRLTDMLFPEMLFPGTKLPSEGPGQAPTSTLGRENETQGSDRDGLPKKLIDSVMAISSEGFSRVIDQPNDHVDDMIRIHNYD